MTRQSTSHHLCSVSPPDNPRNRALVLQLSLLEMGREWHWFIAAWSAVWKCHTHYALFNDSIPPFAIKGNFKATSSLPPCRAALHFTPSCQNATVVSGCHKDFLPHMASTPLSSCLLLSFALWYLHYTPTFKVITLWAVSQCNKSFWSMKILSWQARCWGKIFMHTLQYSTLTGIEAFPANHIKL